MILQRLQCRTKRHSRSSNAIKMDTNESFWLKARGVNGIEQGLSQRDEDDLPDTLHTINHTFFLYVIKLCTRRFCWLP